MGVSLSIECRARLAPFTPRQAKSAGLQGSLGFNSITHLVFSNMKKVI